MLEFKLIYLDKGGPDYVDHVTRQSPLPFIIKQWTPFPDAIFKCIFFNENVWIFIKISLKFVPRGPINIIPSLV